MTDRNEKLIKVGLYLEANAKLAAASVVVAPSAGYRSNVLVSSVWTRAR